MLHIDNAFTHILTYTTCLLLCTNNFTLKQGLGFWSIKLGQVNHMLYLLESSQATSHCNGERMTFLKKKKKSVLKFCPYAVCLLKELINFIGKISERPLGKLDTKLNNLFSQADIVLSFSRVTHFCNRLPRRSWTFYHCIFSNWLDRSVADLTC